MIAKRKKRSVSFFCTYVRARPAARDTQSFFHVFPSCALDRSSSSYAEEKTILLLFRLPTFERRDQHCFLFHLCLPETIEYLPHVSFAPCFVCATTHTVPKSPQNSASFLVSLPSIKTGLSPQRRLRLCRGGEKKRLENLIPPTHSRLLTDVPAVFIQILKTFSLTVNVLCKATTVDVYIIMTTFEARLEWARSFCRRRRRRRTPFGRPASM